MILFLRRFIHSPHLNVYRYVVESLVLVILLLFSPWWTVERTLPWQSIWGNKLSWASRYDIVPFIEESEQTPIEIYIDEKLVTSISPKYMGIYYDIEDLYRTLYAEQKPASVVKQSLNNIVEVPVLVYEELLDSVFDEVQSKTDVKATNAKIEL
ncbi:MAG: hypothetical protein Q7T41_03085, partial [Candidatus Saccharibacteria bacterium]|nr:hypothetical protein [Candidatus Saccharibacteria bacterium]